MAQQPIRSFRDPSTNRLKAWGRVTENAPGDISQIEPDEFNLDLQTHAWIWNGSAWVAVPQATLDTEKTAAQRIMAQGLLSSPDGTYKLLRAVGTVLLDQLNTIRSLIPRGLVSITRTGTTATATAFVAHGLTNGEQVFIGGATVAAYNGAKTITVTSPTVFTFAVAGSPATPATGSISFVLGTVTSLEPITQAQVNAAILAKISGGLVDNGA